ncbi:MAG: S26 family signal peptidase [Brevundimonas sp.]|nr:S26 family signal peptidase [Brevundimonas sp.]
MTSPLDNGNRWPALGVALFFLGCGGSLLVSERPALALINESPSVPRGVYVRVVGAAPVRGDTVALAQPPGSRVYLGGLGMPGEVRLLKRVAGSASDEACRIGDRLQVGGRTVTVLRTDRRGVNLPQWSGCRRLEAGEVFLLGDTPGSFDSRYFGPVRVTDLDGVFREILTW